MDVDKQISWTKEHFPDAVAYLNPPARLADIKALEEKLGVSLPEELQAFYLRANGQEDTAGPGFFFDLEFMSLEKMLSETEMWKKISEDPEYESLSDRMSSHKSECVKSLYANSKWIAFATDGCGNNIGIDYDPGPLGTIGQIINFGSDQEKKYVIAESFSQFMKWYGEQLEGGRIEQVECGYYDCLFPAGTDEVGFIESLPILFE